MTDYNPAAGDRTSERRELDSQRNRLAVRIGRALRTPMTILALVWLVLFVIDFTSGLSPFMVHVSYLIWGVFIFQFVLELTLSPHKLGYLKHNWLTAIALVVPAVRLFGAVRALRVLSITRGARLVRVVGSVNRAMRSVGRVMGRRGFGYVASLSGLVILAGGAGMYAFERGVPGSTVTSLGSAMWWTAMTLTTMGSDYFPKTPEGRFLCLLLALYGFAVFGYITATIASLFVARDADEDDGEVAGARQIQQLRREVAAMHQKLDAIAAAIQR